MWPIVMVTPPTWLETTETTNETVGAVGAPLGASLEDGNQAGVGEGGETSLQQIPEIISSPSIQVP